MRKIIVICGLPGSGKSTLAEGIAQKLALPLFSVDPIESAILQSGIQRSFETGLAAYLVAEALAAEHLRLDLSVLIDAVSGVKEAWEMWLHLANQTQAQLIIIECTLASGLHKSRIESRVRNIAGIPEVTWADVQNRRTGYAAWDGAKLVLDTAHPIEANLEKALAYIAAAAMPGSISG